MYVNGELDVRRDIAMAKDGYNPEHKVIVISYGPTAIYASFLDGEYLMMTSSNGNIFRVTGHLCGEFTGDSPVTGEFPAQRPVTRSFDVFFDLRLNKRLSKQS